MLLEIELFKIYIYNNDNNNNNNNDDDMIIINIIIIIIIIILIFIIKKFFLKKKLELKVWVVKSVDPQLSNTPKLLPAHWGIIPANFF